MWEEVNFEVEAETRLFEWGGRTSLLPNPDEEMRDRHQKLRDLMNATSIEVNGGSHNGTELKTQVRSHD